MFLQCKYTFEYVASSFKGLTLYNSSIIYFVKCFKIMVYLTGHWGGGGCGGTKDSGPTPSVGAGQGCRH